MSAPIPSFLADPHLQLLLFGGKGGVGKTSCATATALKLAKDFPGAAFLLASTDPAHSLADSLAGFLPPPNLQIIELDAQECLAAFKRRHSRQLEEIASRGTFLDQEDISRFLGLSLPGLDELMALLEISGWVGARRCQCIVVDTAPTGHTLRLLAMPALVRKWLAALDALLAKHRYMKRLFSGALIRDEMDHFLQELADSINRMEALLRDPARSRFVPVMLPTQMCLGETSKLLGELNRARVPVTDIVINQLYPQNHCTVCANERSSQARLLRKALASRVFSSYAFWGVPLFPGEMRGAKALEMLWTQTTMVTRETFSVARPITLAFPRVEATVALPSTESTLLIFAGKGGVGKTTLSCATSLRLAEDFPSKEVLLCSTDPAQSLSACLVLPVGLSPKRLCPGLTVLELDAQAEFNALKQLYAQELKAFLHALMPNMNLAFDQEAMEKMLDLSPPGLDEIMALTRVMDLIEHGRYHRLVLDSAPTGHLIRLLEMPELVDQWLKVFFGLFLKYKQIFRLPKVTQHLVAMSKNLKRLRAMLADPSQCAIYGVTILTEMAFEETEDLAAACKRMRVHLSLLFLNLATPPSECPLCSALHQRETVIRHKYQQTFPNTQQVLVYRQGEPRGLSRLGELAQALYGAPVKMCVNYA